MFFALRLSESDMFLLVHVCDVIEKKNPGMSLLIPSRNAGKSNGPSVRRLRIAAGNTSDRSLDAVSSLPR